MNEHEMLIEAATTAWRPRAGTGGIRPHPAWADLDTRGRLEAYESTRILRRIEGLLDPDGLSTTAHAVLTRIAQ